MSSGTSRASFSSKATGTIEVLTSIAGTRTRRGTAYRSGEASTDGVVDGAPEGEGVTTVAAEAEAVGRWPTASTLEDS